MVEERADAARNRMRILDAAEELFAFAVATLTIVVVLVVLRVLDRTPAPALRLSPTCPGGGS